MIQQKLGLFFLLCLCNAISKAQTAVGVEAGVSSSYLNTNISNRVSTTINYGAGYTINIPFQYKLKHWLYIETAPGIIQKNYFIDRADSFAGIYEEFKNTYLQLPVMAKFLYGKHRLQVYADAGLYVGYWLTGRVKGVVPNIFNITEDAQGNGMIGQSTYNEKYDIDPETDNRFEVGWIAGVGAQYHFNHKYMLTASAKYYQSLSNQQKEYMINQIPQYNQTYTFSLGFMKSLR